jgi:transcriptional regulator with XRE-family HTH domain
MADLTGTLAQVLERERELRGINQAEMARQIGVTPQRVSTWLRGGGVALGQLQLIANWLRVPRRSLEPLAGFPEDSDAMAELDPRLAAFLSEVELGWRAMDEQERERAERVARVLFAVPPAMRATGQEEGRAPGQSPRRSNQRGEDQSGPEGSPRVANDPLAVLAA